MTAVTGVRTWSPDTAFEPESRTLTAEHRRLRRDLFRRADPVRALIAAHVWPDAELASLIRFVRTEVLRQASDEEVLLYPNGAAGPFSELSAEHGHLLGLTDRLERADPASYSLSELGRLVDDLLVVFEHHLHAEEAALSALGGLAGPADIPPEVPAAADVRSGARAWLAPDDTPVLIRLDALPQDRAIQLCIERLLRLRAGQSADVRSSHDAELAQVCRWMRSFDSAGYQLAPLPSECGRPGLRITRRRTA